MKGRQLSALRPAFDSAGTIRSVPYILAQSAVGWILPSVSASSTVAQTGTTVTVTNGASAAHNIPATTFDGMNVFFPGSTNIPAGWYAGFSRTGAATYTFTRATATVASESVNGGAAYTTETTAVSVTLPAGAMGAQGQLRFASYGAMFSSANNKITRVKFGGTEILTNTVTTSVSVRFEGPVIQNRNDAAKQVYAGASAAQVGGNSGAAGALGYAAINTAAEVTILYTLQCAAAAEYVVLASYGIEVLPAV